MYKLSVDTYNIFNRHVVYSLEFVDYWQARNYMFNFDEGLDFSLIIYDEFGRECESVRRGRYIQYA